MEAILDTLIPYLQRPDVQRGLVLIGLKSALILMLAAAVAWTLREASAARRHLVWTMALCSVLLLPFLELALPAWRVGLMEPVAPVTLMAVPTPPIPPEPPVPVAVAPIAPGHEAHVLVVPHATMPPQEAFASPARVFPPLAWLGFAWLAGFLGVGLYYLVGLLRLNAWTGKADPVEDERVRQIARDVIWELDVTRPVALRWTDDAVTPLTFGILKPVVLLPRAAEAWDDERLRVVLLHELAHVRRLDALTQTIAQVACALFWFNPLVWWGAHRLRVERERACDDYVLARGTRASAYAAHLLEIARSLRGRAPVGVVSMAHRGELEGRLLAILEPERRREILNRAVTVGAGVLFAVVLLPLAAFKPWDVQAQQLTATYQAPLAPLAPKMALAPRATRAPDAPQSALPLTDRADIPGSETIRRTFTVRPGGTLELRTDIGSLVVMPGDGDRVEVEVEHNLEGFSVAFDQRGNTVSVRGEHERRTRWNWGRNQQAQFRVYVPERFNANLNTSGGSIRIGDLEGNVEVRTSGGSLRFGHIKGRVRGHTSGGSIQLDGTSGEVEVETSGGSIRLGDVGGTVRAETSGGSISIREVGGQVYARTSGGSIEATITKQPRGQGLLETSGGSIRVQIAEGINLDLDAATSGGRVRSAFHPEHDRDRNRGGTDALKAPIGRGGPVLNLRTSAGGIHVSRIGERRSSAPPAAPQPPSPSGTLRYSYSLETDSGRKLEAKGEESMAAFGESIADIVGMALQEAFGALDAIDWEAEFAAEMEEMTDEELREVERELEEAQRELAEAQRELARMHLNKEDVRLEVEQALREARNALREAQRERQARCRAEGRAC